MKNIDATVQAVMTLQQNAETEFEKKLVDKFIAKLLNQPKEKVCPVCGKVFVPGSRQQHCYCSKKCRAHYYYQQSKKVEKICLNCGKVFYSSVWLQTQKFCSKRCFYDYQKKIIQTK